VVGLDRVAVMAALNVSNELLQNKNKQTDAQAKVAARVQKLSDRVADAISANKQMQI
jgi:cell division protein ZapA